MIREAVIPAAGRGMRLDRPNMPKPLVDVGGQPMVVRLIRQLASIGVENGDPDEQDAHRLAAPKFDLTFAFATQQGFGVWGQVHSVESRGKPLPGEERSDESAVARIKEGGAGHAVVDQIKTDTAVCCLEMSRIDRAG